MHPFEAESRISFLNDGLTNTHSTCFLAAAVQGLASAFSNLPITIQHTRHPAEQQLFSTLLFQLIDLLQTNHVERHVRASHCDELLQNIVSHPSALHRFATGEPQCVGSAMEEIGVQVREHSPFLFDFMYGTQLRHNRCDICRSQRSSKESVDFPITLNFPEDPSMTPSLPPDQPLHPAGPLNLLDLISFNFPAQEVRPNYICPNEACPSVGQTISSNYVSWPALNVFSLNRIILQEDGITKSRKCNPVTLPMVMR